MKRNIRTAFVPLFSIALFLLLQGCQPSENTTDLESVTKDLQDTLRSAQKSISNMGSEGSEVATEEIAKLFTFEYKVVELQKGMDSSEIESTLASYGKQRWDCFHVEPTEASLRFYCKRRPKSYLRYIPRVF